MAISVTGIPSGGVSRDSQRVQAAAKPRVTSSLPQERVELNAGPSTSAPEPPVPTSPPRTQVDPAQQATCTPSPAAMAQDLSPGAGPGTLFVENAPHLEMAAAEQQTVELLAEGRRMIDRGQASMVLGLRRAGQWIPAGQDVCPAAGPDPLSVDTALHLQMPRPDSRPSSCSPRQEG